MKTEHGKGRKAVQVALITLALTTLAFPPLVVAASGTAGISATWTSLRIAALFALTLVFLNIMTGSLRPLLARAFNAKALFRTHNATGLAGFSLALAHGILVAVYGIWPGFTKLGPVTIYILALTTLAVLARKSLRKIWRHIHRLNYVVFAVAVIHAFQVGTDLRNGAFLKVTLFVYSALAAAGFVYRLQETIRRRKPAR